MFVSVAVSNFGPAKAENVALTVLLPFEAAPTDIQPAANCSATGDQVGGRRRGSAPLCAR